MTSIEDVKKPADIPQKLLMAAFQLHATGRVDKQLLLDPSLRNMMSAAERQAIRRGEFRDDMQIVDQLDQLIDIIHQQDAADKQWRQMKEAYPPSVIKVAQEIEAHGVLQHNQIFGDAFMGEGGRPYISGEKLGAIRAGRVDPTDPDYAAFLSRVDIARDYLRAEALREIFFDHVVSSYAALQEWEQSKSTAKNEWQTQLQAQAQAQLVAFTNFALRVSSSAREMFVDGPDAKKNRAVMAKTLNAAVASSIILAAVTDTPALPPETVAAPASDRDDAAALSLQDLTPPAQTCNTRYPLFVDGKTYNFMIDDPKLCSQLYRVLPEKGATLRLNNSISLRANMDGTYYFRIETVKTRAECLRNAPTKLRNNYLMQTWARAAAREAGTDMCHERVVKENVITSRNMNAMIEAWLYSGGRNGTPVNFTYFLSKWFLESRHGNLMDNPTTTAKGMNQFIAGTWVDQIIHNGDRMGYGALRTQLVGIAARIGISEAQLNQDSTAVTKLSRIKEVRQLHRMYTLDPYHSAIFGSDYSLSGLLRLQRAFENGDIKHPLGPGHTEVTAKMGYICHLLGFEGCRDFFAAYAKNPDQKARAVLKRGPYKRNAYLFQAHIYKRDENGEILLDDKGNKKTKKVVEMTLREFTQYLEVFGFDDRPMEGLRHYRRLEADALAVNNRLSQVTFLTPGEVPDYELKASPDARVALAEPQYPRWMRQMLPAEAEKRPSGETVTASAAAARPTTPSL